MKENVNTLYVFIIKPGYINNHLILYNELKNLYHNGITELLKNDKKCKFGWFNTTVIDYKGIYPWNIFINNIQENSNYAAAKIVVLQPNSKGDYKLNILSKGYVSVQLKKSSVSEIKAFLQYCGVYKDNDERFHSDYHVTMMYDKRNPSLNYKQIKEEYKAKVVGLSCMGTGEWRAIVLNLQCENMKLRHEQLKMMGMKHSYSEFVPHMSLMYRPTEDEENKIFENASLLIGKEFIFNNETIKKIKE